MTEAESAIRNLFRAYLDGYNELDAEKLAGLHANPTIMVHRGEVFTLTDANNVAYHESILAENAAEEHVREDGRHQNRSGGPKRSHSEAALDCETARRITLVG